MGKRHIGRSILFGVMAIMIVLTLLQLFSTLRHKPSSTDATQLLYQVSLFQMELLTSTLKEAPQLKGTEELNGLKQAVYAAGYTHEKLMLALGDEQLTSLNSLNELLQWITRLQIGGERALKPDEVKLLASLYPSYQTIYNNYSELLSSGGHVISSKNDKIAEIDKTIAEQLRKKALQ